MDDHPSTISRDSSHHDAEPALDCITAELKAEFAKLEKRRLDDEAKASLISSKIDRARIGLATRSLHTAVDAALNALRLLDHLSETLKTVQQKEFCTAVLKIARSGLSKQHALLARSLRATLRTPLLLDGPELSGYKHRLR